MAAGDRGTERGAPFLVFGRWTTPCIRSTLGHFIVAISSRLIPVSRANLITSSNGGFADSKSFISSSLLSLLVLPPGSFGLLAFLMGFERLSMPQSDAATSKRRERIARSNLIVFGPAPSLVRRAMKSAMSLVLIEAMNFFEKGWLWIAFALFVSLVGSESRGM